MRFSNEPAADLSRQQRPPLTGAILAAGSRVGPSISCNFRDDVAKLKSDTVAIRISRGGKFVAMRRAGVSVLRICCPSIHTDRSDNVAKFKSSAVVVATAGGGA